jgi:hypothetical protein
MRTVGQRVAGGPTRDVPIRDWPTAQCTAGGWRLAYREIRIGSIEPWQQENTAEGARAQLG